MKIQVGRYTLESDLYSMWISEECEGKDANGKPKKSTRRVAGYARDMKNLTSQFCDHKYKSSDAETMRELLKVLTQTFEDMKALDEAAVKKDFRIIRKIQKERGIK